MKEGYRFVKQKGTRSIRICKHHGETEFMGEANGKWRCLTCQRERNQNIKHSNTPGCATYVGIHIAEQVLKKAFDVMIKAHPMKHYDFICGKDFTVDSKCSTKRNNHGWDQWEFRINKNKIPKYFCLIALDNTPENVADDPKPIHVWLVPGDALIDGKYLNEKNTLCITPRTLGRLAKYRRTDMEGKIIKCCNHLKDNKT